MTERHTATWAVIACVLFWGLSFISIKAALPVFPPMTLGLFRFAAALIFLFVIKLKFAPREALRFRDLPLLCGAGITGVTLYFFCENNGVALVTASEASIITGAIPVLTMTAEWIGGRLSRSPSGIFPRERLGGRRWLGAAISMAGVWMVAGVSFALSGSLLGYAYMGGAALSWVAYCFLTRPLFARRGGGGGRIYIVFWQSVFGAAAFLPFAIAEYPQWGRPDLPVLLHILFLGICCSALGYWLYAHSLETLGVSVSSVFINFIPVVTVTAGFFILGERLTLLQWTGAALVVGGVYLTMGREKRGGRS
ncbi:MAG: DMT family transporter [Spirochaetaceae bacterium]|jgi:drug/metabolite transporter (DMT)-like permease|nr:DMT family transporter [Spirochaetaceae bacterium]